MYHYRFYDENRVWISDCQASNFSEACRIFSVPMTTRTIFSVEDDGHEIECGDGWIEELLNNPANRI